jgi:DNA polymerase-4
MIELRKIVHVDMDAFYASVEQRDNPELRGKPVVVAWTGPRSVVCAASYEARRFGIHSAMSAARAERLCPHAIYVPPDFNRYREVSRQVRQIFARHTDMIEPLSLDEAYLDVTVNKLGLPSATEVAQVIRQQIREETGLTASAGVAPNKFLAKIASDWNKPDGLFVVRPAKVLAFLEPLPVRKVPGVGKVTQARLEQLGIHTVGDLATHSAQELEHYFGRYGRRLYELARGIDEREVQTDQPLQQVSSETTFSQDIRLDAVGEAIDRMAERVWDQALKKGAPDRGAQVEDGPFPHPDAQPDQPEPARIGGGAGSRRQAAVRARGLAAGNAVPAGGGGDEQFRRPAGAVAPARSVRGRVLSRAGRLATVSGWKPNGSQASADSGQAGLHLL